MTRDVTVGPLRHDADDAARYRWLRERFAAVDFAYEVQPLVIGTALVFRVGGPLRFGANIDATIDIARLGALANDTGAADGAHDQPADVASTSAPTPEDSTVLRAITLRSQIHAAARDYEAAVALQGCDEDDLAIIAALHRMDVNTATADDLARLIGNTSWACPQECTVCKQSYPAVVLMGETPTEDSRTILACRGCLLRAIETLDAEEAPGEAAGAAA